jgi:hypothetical protein
MIRFRYDPGTVQVHFHLPVKLSADEALTPAAKEALLGPSFAESFAIAFLLPDHLERELDFPRFRRCRSYQAFRAR